MMASGKVIGFLLNIQNKGAIRMESRNVVCCGGEYVIATISECDNLSYISLTHFTM